MLSGSIIILVLIFVINVIPAFMPPTWMLMSFAGFSFHLSDYGLVILAVLAAVAATSGRIVLALFSKKIIRAKVLSETARQNIDVLKQNIEKRKVFTFGFFLAYAFSPLPSGQLFLAYGLTNLKIRLAAIPFFTGRLVSYLFWAFTASEVSERLDVITFKTGAYFSVYFILAQVAAFYLVYLFIKIDWAVLFNEHKVRFIKKI